jgi:hypothetical protein
MAVTHHLDNSVKRIVRLDKDESGATHPVVLYGEDLELHGSKKYRNAEKTVTRLMQAQNIFSNTYLARHKMSSAKKKDGWKKDFGKNLSKAFKAGKKKAKFKLKVI